MNPLSVLLWGAGLWYFFSKRGARYRVFGWAYLILFVLFIVIQGKILLSGAGLPAVVCRWGDADRAVAGALADGGQMGRGLCRGAGPEWRAAGPRGDAGVATRRVCTGVWQELATRGSQQESGDVYGLPQSLADRFGWEEQVALIAQVYHSLPPDEQRVACIFTENYGEAGALVQFGGRYHLPPPISGHNAFYLWGPEGCTGQVLITINICSPGRRTGVRLGDAGRQDVLRCVCGLRE